MRLRQINKKEFETFCKSSPLSNFFQTKEYAELKRKEGYHTYFVGLDDSGRLLAAALLISSEFTVTKKRVFFCPRGYIIDYRNQELLNIFTKELVTFVKEKKGALIKINPNLMLKERDENGNIISGGMNNSKCVNNLLDIGYKKINSNYLVNPNFLYTLDLKGKNNDELYDNISPTVKSIIERNEKIGITVSKIDKENSDKFLSILRNCSNRIDYFKKNDKSYKNVISVLSNYHMVDIIMAELDIDKYLEVTKRSLENALNDSDLSSQVQKQLEIINNLQYKYGHKVSLGTLLAVSYNNQYLTLCIADMDKFKNFDPISTLIWESMKRAKKMSATKYILYGMDSNLENENNLIHYYKKFNGKAVELIGEYDFVIDQRNYQKYLKKQEKIRNKN